MEKVSSLVCRENRIRKTFEEKYKGTEETMTTVELLFLLS